MHAWPQVSVHLLSFRGWALTKASVVEVDFQRQGVGPPTPETGVQIASAGQFSPTSLNGMLLTG